MIFTFDTVIVCIISLAVFGAYNLILPLSVVSNVHSIVFVTYPVSSFLLFLLVLGLSLDTSYTPTGLCVLWYIVVMSRYASDWITLDFYGLLKLSGFVACYVAMGIVWIRWKWRLFLLRPENAYQVQNMREGNERDFFQRHVPMLFPHFVYWPLSIVHAMSSDLVYRLFEMLVQSFGGFFANEVAARRAQLNKQ